MSNNNYPELTHKAHLRADVAWALFQILESGRSARDILPLILGRHHKTMDKGWLQECLYGCLRELPKLQYWTHQLLEKPLKADTKIAEHVIMQGLFQLTHMRTSDHAAVSESVAAIKTLKKPKLAGLVNAVMRNFMRKSLHEQPISQEHINHAMPKWLLKQLQQDYHQQWQSICEHSNQRPSLFLRVNISKISTEQYAKKLTSQDISFKIINERCIKLLSPAIVQSLPGFDSGEFSVQDLAAQQASRLLEVKAGEDVLDCCAAPGGKTAAILEQSPELNSLIAIDNQPERIARMRENLERLGFSKNPKITLIVDDASILSQVESTRSFDKILLDAPCSATGIIRRHPDIKWLRKRADIDALVELQGKILAETWQRLKEGGTLLYATCSILAAENKHQISRFLAENDDAELLSIQTNETQDNPGWQILPGEQDMDGFYYAKIQKRATRS